MSVLFFNINYGATIYLIIKDRQLMEQVTRASNLKDIMRTPFSAYLSAVWRRIDKKTAGFVAVLLVLILFGDTLLPLLGHVLHVLIEVIESVLEHFLESVFHVSPRQAQVILFYSGLAIAIYLSWYLTRKAHSAALRVYATAQERRRSIASSAKAAAWFRIMVMVGALSATFYLFT